jgi:hypothetical protein
MATKLKIEKRGDEILIIHPFFLFLAWWPSWLEVEITGHNFGRRPFHQSVVAIGPVVSEEKIKM